MEERRKLGFAKMKAMITYVEQTHRCRTQLIQEYFDEVTYATCGVCDVCIEKKKRENLAALEDYQSQVLYLLKQKPMTVEELENAVSPDEHELFLEVVRELVDRSMIAYDEILGFKDSKAIEEVGTSPRPGGEGGAFVCLGKQANHFVYRSS